MSLCPLIYITEQVDVRKFFIRDTKIQSAFWYLNPYFRSLRKKKNFFWTDKKKDNVKVFV